MVDCDGPIEVIETGSGLQRQSITAHRSSKISIALPSEMLTLVHDAVDTGEY
jgi:hypothetical protein